MMPTASATAMMLRARAGICLLENIGARMKSGETRPSTSMNVITCVSPNCAIS